MDNKNSKVAMEAEPAVKREKQKKCKKTYYEKEILLDYRAAMIENGGKRKIYENQIIKRMTER